MEKEGLVRTVDFIQNNGLAIGTLVTDRHPQIQWKKLVRENLRQTVHYYDVWHVAKGTTSCLCGLQLASS